MKKEKMNKEESGSIILLAAVFLFLGFINGMVFESYLITNINAGEAYQVLSITAPQQKENVWIGTKIKDIDNQIIITLKEQNGNRIIFIFRNQDEIPDNLKIGDIIIFTKNEQTKILGW